MVIPRKGISPESGSEGAATLATSLEGSPARARLGKPTGLEPYVAARVMTNEETEMHLEGAHREAGERLSPLMQKARVPLVSVGSHNPFPIDRASRRCYRGDIDLKRRHPSCTR